MKYYIIRTVLLIVFTLWGYDIFSQQFATLDGGERIIVYADGTWSKVGAAKPTFNATPKYLRHEIVGDELIIEILVGSESRKLTEKIVLMEGHAITYNIGKSKKEPKFVDIVTDYIMIGTKKYKWNHFVHSDTKKPYFSEKIYPRELRNSYVNYIRGNYFPKKEDAIRAYVEDYINSVFIPRLNR